MSSPDAPPANLSSPSAAPVPRRGAALSNAVGSDKWRPFASSAIALFPFPGFEDEQLSLNMGDVVRVREEFGGWFRGVLDGTDRSGVFPRAYVRLIVTTTEAADASQDQLVREVTKTMIEWGVLFRTHFRERKYDEFELVRDRLRALVDVRRTLMVADRRRRAAMHGEVIAMLEEGRSVMGLALIPRTATGEEANETNTPIIRLYRMHQSMVERRNASQGASSTRRKMPSRSLRSFGMRARLKRFRGMTLEQQAQRATLLGDALDALPANLLSGSDAFGSYDGTLTSALTTALTGRGSNKRSSVGKGGRGALGADPPGHLHLNYKAFICDIQDPNTEATFFLYRHNDQRIISEPFSVALQAGLPPIDLLGDIQTLFCNISDADLTSQDLYLACRICRLGPMIYQDRKNSKHAFRRPFGWAVLHLSDAILSRAMGIDPEAADLGTEISDEAVEADNGMLDLVEVSIKIFATTEEEAFARGYEHIINGTGGYREVPTAKGVFVELALYRGDIEDVLFVHPALSRVQLTQKMSFEEDIIMPGTTRNDLYITLVGGEFQQDRKKSAKNIEITVSVINNGDGTPVPNCLSGGDHVAGPQDTFSTYVTYHNNRPFWYETLRVNVPVELYERVHLFFSVAHCSKSDGRKDFSFAFYRLTTPTGTVIPNGLVELPCFKPGKASASQPCAYLLSSEGSSRFAKRSKEFLRFETRYCSTELTQYDGVHAILNWRTHYGSLADSLRGITYVDHYEIVKFLEEVFNALFEILDVNASDAEIPQLVYDAVVFLIALIVDERAATRLKKYVVVLDVYISDHLGAHATAHTVLIRMIRSNLASIDDASPQSAARVLPTFKALEYLMRLAIRSHQLHLPAEGSAAQEEADFQAQLASLFADLNALMQREQPSNIIGAQTTAVRYFAAMLREAGKVFSPRRVSELACAFVESIREHEGTQLNFEKLLLIQKLFCRAFDESGRADALPVFIAQLRRHMTGGSEGESCVVVVGDMLDAISAHTPESRADQVWQLSSLLLPMMETFLRVGTAARDELNDLTTAILALLYLMSDDQLDRYYANFETDIERRSFLIAVGDAVSKMFEDASYPDNWRVMVLFRCTVLLKVLSRFTRHIPRIFRGDAFDRFAVTRYIQLLGRFATLPVLQLEDLPPTVAAKQAEAHGDMRAAIIVLVQRLWGSLGENQGDIPQMVPLVLRMARVPAEGIVDHVVDIFFSLLRIEFLRSSSFHAMEVETVDTLDKAINSEAHAAVFTAFLEVSRARVESEAGLTETFRAAANAFLADVAHLVELVMGLRALPAGAEYEDDRAIATLELMEYLKRTDRRKFYVRYVHKLANVHSSSGHWVEAAFTTLLHAELLSWDDVDDTLAAADGFPEQSSFERKVALYHDAIDMFAKGKDWENAVRLCTELAVQYETAQFDYAALAKILERKTALCKSIAKTPRFFWEYYRVGFFGQGFPPALRNRVFVSKGEELQRIGDFQDGLEKKFPRAVFLNTNEPPDEALFTTAGMHIQLTQVDPVVDEGAIDPRMPGNVAQYHRFNGVSRFAFTRRLKKVEKDRNNEFATLWSLVTEIETKDVFPCSVRRSEVVSTREYELSPVENAVIQVKDKTAELRVLYAKHSANRTADATTLTLCLKGIIDAAVNGGTKNFVDAFVVSDFATTSPEYSDQLVELKRALGDQLAVCSTAMVLHAELIPDEMGALHEHLAAVLETYAAEITPLISAEA